MKDNPDDPDSPIWTADDFARAVSSAETLPPYLASLLVRQSTGLKTGLARQRPLARGLGLAA